MGVSDKEYYEKHKERLQAKSRDWYRRNKDKVAEQKKKRYLENRDNVLIDRRTFAEKYPVRMLLAHAKSRSKARGYEYSLSEDDITIPDNCPYLGVPLTNIQGQGIVDTNLSLDRIDPTKGYVPGNVQVISHLANRMKNNATLDELRLFAKNVIELHP